jgi:16S rRNA G966 N2-methylase RsmD
MTAGCGGNMISFINYFAFVDGFEIDFKRYEMLKSNLQKYNKNNNYKVFNDDCNNIDKYYNYDVYFIDPPWGGPEYKNNTYVELYLSKFTLEEIIKNKIPKNKLIVIKVPFNYNINWCKNFIINKIFLNNIIILFLKINSKNE